MVDNVKTESVIQHYQDSNAMEVESDDDVTMYGNDGNQINQQQYQHSNDGLNGARNVRTRLSLKWIDLKNNRGITNDGVDRLNLIFARKIQPTAAFSVCVNGCSYEPNPHWDLALL